MRTPLLGALAAIFLPAATAALAADLALPIERLDVRASLTVDANRLDVATEVRLARPPASDEPWRFLLNADLGPPTARLAGGEELAVEATEGWNPRHFWTRPPYAELAEWEIAHEVAVGPPAGGWGTEPPTVVLEYSGVVADSLHAPDRAYGRGFETTTGRIVEKGAFLAGGTFWVPWSGEEPFAFDLEVEGPAAWRTVSQGELVTDVVAADRRTMRWKCDSPMEEIYLIAGPYELREIDHRGVKIQAFCYESTGPDITDRYLEATGPILDGYDALFGPYPYPKFALVENYWQTGYGMPSFTFLGDRVIRLPFILHTSYPHEILHNWWGNGVYVDSESGNWCEGLTTYCADYRAKERESPKAARDYRRNQLVGYRDFATAGGRDFALAKFRERDSAATQAVGYGKTLMVYHMLRRRVGDEVFFAALRRFYADNLYRRADWDDVRAAFEAETGEDLGPWFDQWIRRPGAVRLTLDGVATEPAEDGWVTSGWLVQEDPVFAVRVPVRVAGSGEEIVEEIPAGEARTRFEIRSRTRPETVAADAGYDLFRVLHAEEVAPTLSGILGAEATRIVVGRGATGDTRDALFALAETWGTDSTFTVVEEADGETLAEFAGGTWFFGPGPAADGFRATLPAGGGDGPAEGVSLVAAGRPEGRLDRPAAVLLPASAEVVAALGRKIPHYSKYSFLRFEGERNVDKGQWDAGASPLTVRLAAAVPAPTPAPVRSSAAVPAAGADPRAGVERIVELLASDEARGRGAGSAELETARDRVRGWLEAAGASPGLDGEWFQRFEGPDGVPLDNVVARLAGAGDECVVIGAHYDGLGIGAPDSEYPGEIHNGADDNASGVAALVLIARTLAGAGELERDVVLIAFSGEEIGRLGSEHYVQNPAVPLEKTVAMLNLDTIGGLEADRLIVFGTGTGEELEPILRGVNHSFGFDLAPSSEGAGASDHASFFAKGVPVLHFFTGARATYHRPGDDVAGVNVAGVERIADFVAEVALHLSGADVAVTFRPVGAERLAEADDAPETTRRRVSFGSIPDFSRESGGILLSGVMPNGAAEAAGLREGDLIVEIDGVGIDNIYDFQGALSERSAGDRVGVVFLRDGERQECDVVLKERK